MSCSEQSVAHQHVVDFLSVRDTLDLVQLILERLVARAEGSKAKHGTQALDLLDDGLQHDHNGLLVILAQHVAIAQLDDLLLQIVLLLANLLDLNLHAFYLLDLVNKIFFVCVL